MPIHPLNTIYKFSFSMKIMLNKLQYYSDLFLKLNFQKEEASLVLIDGCRALSLRVERAYLREYLDATRL